MKILCGIVVLLLPNFILAASISKGEDLFDAEVFLSNFGYLAPISKDNEYKQHSEFEIKQSISDFQKFTGLEQTGFLDEATLTKMKAPRCGCPDIIRIPEAGNQFDPSSPLPFTTLGTKWEKKIITWKPTSYSRQLSGQVQLSTIQKALDHWAQVTPLEFIYTDGTPDIEIKFVSGNHGDGAGNAFDGRDGVLAHAFQPGNFGPISGDAHFDEAELWVVEGRDGKDLEIVAAHEFGHSIGLGHSERPEALMAPYYQYTPELKLAYDDVRAAQTLYGSNSNPKPTTQAPDTTPTTTDTPTTTAKPEPRITVPTTKPDYCNMKLDAIDLGPGNYVFGYKDKMIYKMDKYGLIAGYPRAIQHDFPGAPNRLRAVVYNPAKQQTYMFKGKLMWRYTGFRLDRDYPKKINTTFPEKPHAAVWYNDGYIRNKMFLFGHKYFWEWDPNTEIINRVMNINEFWRGVPDGLEAALQHSDGYIYFFKGLKYRKFNPKYRFVEDDYPQTYSPAWFKGACGNQPL